MLGLLPILRKADLGSRADVSLLPGQASPEPRRLPKAGAPPRPRSFRELPDPSLSGSYRDPQPPPPPPAPAPNRQLQGQ
jgi:hypothetical protein